MGKLFGFLGLVAMFVFAMGLVTHPDGAAKVINSISSGTVNLLSLELGSTKAVG